MLEPLRRRRGDGRLEVALEPGVKAGVVLALERCAVVGQAGGHEGVVCLARGWQGRRGGLGSECGVADAAVGREKPLSYIRGRGTGLLACTAKLGVPRPALPSGRGVSDEPTALGDPRSPSCS